MALQVEAEDRPAVLVEDGVADLEDQLLQDGVYVGGVELGQSVY